MKQQRGGTLLGFIIGVVVGMGAALAVAVYVTKVPVPFVSKGQGHSAEQEAAETKKNKDWDPNAPLYGKHPVRPAQPASASTAPASSPESPATMPVPSKPVSGPGPVASTKADAKALVATDPLGELAKARTAGTPTEPFSFFVQVGAFRTAEDAEGQRAKLLLSGIEAKVTEREQSGRAVFRVRVGPFDKKDEAEKAKDKLDAAGLETALVRVQR
jgi:cell division protein FtsN